MRRRRRVKWLFVLVGSGAVAAVRRHNARDVPRVDVDDLGPDPRRVRLPVGAVPGASRPRALPSPVTPRRLIR